MSRYACAWVPHFAAVALVRRDPALRGRPVAALTGTEATRAVHEASAEAWAMGVRPGMPASEAGTRASALVCRDRDPQAERSAAGALLDLAGSLSPRCMAVAPGRVDLDLAGLDVLYVESRLGERLLDGAASLDLPARVGIASTRTVATLAAHTAPGVTVVPPAEVAAFLAPLPVALLTPEPDLAGSLDRWGIRTLGELAALPTAGLSTRLGPRATRLQALARGEDPEPFVPAVPAEPCVEALTLDWEVTTLDGLAFVLRRLLDRLSARLAVREAGAAALTLTAGLADGGAHVHRLPLAAPLREPRTLLDLLVSGLERLTLPAPIVAIAIEAEPVPLVPLQSDLFAPPRPSPRELAETLGRLTALVGVENVGAPALGDTHRPTAADVAPFTGAVEGTIARRAAVAALAFADAATLACRRVSPPIPAVVTCHDGSPRHVEAPGVRGAVTASAGPWRTAGEWWTDTTWSREEWDVALADGAVYRLVLDRATVEWIIDAVYD